jgi:hypothetical protein
MAADNGDDPVLFQDVKGIQSTAPALLCRFLRRPAALHLVRRAR